MTDSKVPLYRKLPKWIRAKKDIETSLITIVYHSIMLRPEQVIELIELLQISRNDSRRIRKEIAASKYTNYRFVAAPEMPGQFVIKGVKPETKKQYRERLDRELEKYEYAAAQRKIDRERVEAEEKAQLARLKAKYEADKVPV